MKCETWTGQNAGAGRMGSSHGSPRKSRGWPRRAKARQEAALAVETSRRQGALARAEAFVAALQADQCAAIIAEFPATP
jgi:hypothetical protein